MPKVSDLGESKYLKQEDIGEGKLVTISKYELKDVSKDNDPTTEKYVLHFEELEKPLVLNKTNGQAIQRATDSDDFDDWIGKEIVLYVDPNVTFAGEVVGGIRVRSKKQQQQQDDIPF
jgi:hypothetical protein